MAIVRAAVRVARLGWSRYQPPPSTTAAAAAAIPHARVRPDAAGRWIVAFAVRRLIESSALVSRAAAAPVPRTSGRAGRSLFDPQPDPQPDPQAGRRADQ
jgi:hypothetical protein